MRPYVFLDLDDTLFQTRAKCPPGAELHVAASGPDGRPLSFMTEKQRALFDWLDASAAIIPTTARNLAAFRRVHLPFRHGAILNFGGTVLDAEGQLDESWHQRMSTEVAALAAELDDACAGIEHFCRQRAIDVRARVIGDFGLKIYVVAKHSQGDMLALERLDREHLRPRTNEGMFRVHRNGNNLSLVPRAVSKDLAVRHLIGGRLDASGAGLSIGIGDSLTDASFLLACDYGLLPRGSQISEACVGESESVIGAVSVDVR